MTDIVNSVSPVRSTVATTTPPASVIVSAVGPQGEPGPAGAAGGVGPTGPTGPTGPAGADSTVAGPQGLQGIQGPAGPAGADSTVAGPQGPQGIQGIQGPDGPAGADSIVAGPDGPQGIQGPAGPAGAGSIVPGPQGIQGIQGPDGPAGADSIVPGPQGIQGIQGPDGPAGADSTVAGPQGDPGTNGVGVPTGGTAGQFLRKSSGVDYATAFAAIPTSEVTGLDTALAGKVGTASPTFTGTVTLPTQVAGTAGLIYPPGAYLSTPAAGAIEMDAEGLYVTPNTDFGRRRIKAQAVVCSQANSGAATTTTLVNCFAAANDVLSSLAANHTYKVRGVLFFQSTFTSGTPNLRIAWTFSNAPTVIKYTFKTMTATAGTALARTGLVTSAAATQVTANVTSTLQYAVEIDMFIVTHASAASTFTPQFSMSVTGVSMVCAQGSYLEVEEYGSSTATLIAGGWA